MEINLIKPENHKIKKRKNTAVTGVFGVFWGFFQGFLNILIVFHFFYEVIVTGKYDSWADRKTEVVVYNNKDRSSSMDNLVW